MQLLNSGSSWEDCIDLFMHNILYQAFRSVTNMLTCDILNLNCLAETLSSEGLQFIIYQTSVQSRKYSAWSNCAVLDDPDFVFKTQTRFVHILQIVAKCL